MKREVQKEVCYSKEIFETDKKQDKTMITISNFCYEWERKKKIIYTCTNSVVIFIQFTHIWSQLNVYNC